MRKAMDKKDQRIAFYRTDPVSDAIVINKLVEHFGYIYVFDNKQELTALLKDDVSKVILITGDAVPDCLDVYYSAAEYVGRDSLCNHKLVILVPKKDEEHAYEVFRSGLVDDYLVARPVYELHRSIVICEHLLFELGVPSEVIREPVWESPTLASFSTELKDLIKHFHEQRKDFQQLAEQKLQNIDEALAGAAQKIDSDQAVELDLKALTQTLARINEKEIRPEMEQIRNKALSIIDSLTEDVRQVTEENGDPVEADASDTNGSAEATETRPSQGDIRILILDDDAISAQASVNAIKDKGFQTDVAHTGRHAFELLKRNVYSLVFLEINLPDTNGFYVIDMVRNGKSENRGIPFVVLTTGKSKSLIRTAAEYGAGGYMLKPLVKNSFQKVCKKYGLA